MKSSTLQPFACLVETRYPGLLNGIRRFLEKAEGRFEKRKPRKGESFLWEHTAHAAGLAFQLAKAESRNPLVPVLAALFHDAGKFSGGRYHQDNRPEEETSARAARRIMSRYAVKAPTVRRVLDALHALYREGALFNLAAAIVHDADFLSKSGRLGVAGFFAKSTLRGRTLLGAVSDFLSRELTYAAVLPFNMRTRAGRKLALKSSKASLEFYRGFLNELHSVRGTKFVVRTLRVRRPSKPSSSATVRLVYPVRCPDCGGPWKVECSVDKGVKCETLEAVLRCSSCRASKLISFCLPEIPGQHPAFRRSRVSGR